MERETHDKAWRNVANKACQILHWSISICMASWLGVFFVEQGKSQLSLQIKAVDQSMWVAWGYQQIKGCLKYLLRITWLSKERVKMTNNYCFIWLLSFSKTRNWITRLIPMRLFKFGREFSSCKQNRLGFFSVFFFCLFRSFLFCLFFPQELTKIFYHISMSSCHYHPSLLLSVKGSPTSATFQHLVLIGVYNR